MLLSGLNRCGGARYQRETDACWAAAEERVEPYRAAVAGAPGRAGPRFASPPVPSSYGFFEYSSWTVAAMVSSTAPMRSAHWMIHALVTGSIGYFLFGLLGLV